MPAGRLLFISLRLLKLPLLTPERVNTSTGEELGSWGDGETAVVGPLVCANCMLDSEASVKV